MNYRSAALCVSAFAISTTSLAGDLNPPSGPVSETGRFGPRIEINQTNTPGDADSLFKITQSGSYYLGGNITGVASKSGIEIASRNVTIDLMGFELIGVAGSLDGIRTSIVADQIAIRNGGVRGFGEDGVDLRHAGLGRAHHIDAIFSTNNTGSGFSTGENSVVRACTSNSNGVNGFLVGSYSVIETSTAHMNGNDGFQLGSASVVNHCAASFNTGLGIFADGVTIVTESTAFFSGESGFLMGQGTTIIHCTAGFNVEHGIWANANGSVISNTCWSNGFNGTGAGIFANSFGARIDGNYVTENDIGIEITFPQNLIIRNTATRNTVDYTIAGGNDVGPIGSAATSTSPWANISY